jgi:hypothetical protein
MQTDAESAELKALEMELDIPDILLFRSLSERTLPSSVQQSPDGDPDVARCVV